MAKPPKPLRVFRAATGFHDAYVAAPSRAAALRAWGSDKDLFARGVAEEVTDPAAMADALAAPGAVVKRLRGTPAEQLAALPPDIPKRAKRPPEDSDSKPPRKTESKPAPKPKPSRTALDAVETAIADAEARYEEALADLAEREAALTRERGALEKARASETRRLARARDDAADDHAAALERWRRE